MGTLAQTIGASATIIVKGVRVEVNQLSISELFYCLKDALREFEKPPEKIEEAAQEAIETGRIPIAALPILIAKACPSLDHADVNALLSTSNLQDAYRIVEFIMGVDESASSSGAAKNGSTPGKKNESGLTGEL